MKYYCWRVKQQQIQVLGSEANIHGPLAFVRLYFYDCSKVKGNGLIMRQLLRHRSLKHRQALRNVSSQRNTWLWYQELSVRDSSNLAHWNNRPHAETITWIIWSVLTGVHQEEGSSRVRSCRSYHRLSHLWLKNIKCQYHKS